LALENETSNHALPDMGPVIPTNIPTVLGSITTKRYCSEAKIREKNKIFDIFFHLFAKILSKNMCLAIRFASLRRSWVSKTAKKIFSEAKRF
jgi:hypothetical protein